MKRLQRNSVRLSVCYDNVNFTKEQLALLEDRDQTISDLQFSLDERDAQLEEVSVCACVCVCVCVVERVAQLVEEVSECV